MDYLAQLLAVDSKLAASMGNDYMVAPDVVVYREPLTDEELNSQVVIVDDSVALQTDIRAKTEGCRFCMPPFPPNGRCEATVPRTAERKL